MTVTSSPRAPGGRVGTVLRSAARAPGRGDLRGVAWCTAYQVGVIAVAAALSHGRTDAAVAEPLRGPAVELFLHNAVVFALWLAGALTLGLLPAVLATVSSVVSGSSIAAALELHGASVLVYLGHAVVELPALAVALWLAIRPALDLHAVRNGRPGARSDAGHLVRSAGWLIALALVLLAVAAVWESVVVPSW